MKFRVLLFLFSISIGFSTYGQDADSLRVRFEEYVKIHGENAKSLEMLKDLLVHVSNNQQYALELAGQALQIANDLNDKNNQALMHMWIANIYRQQKVYYLAMDYYFKAIKLYQETNEKSFEANCYLELGKTYIVQNVEDLAEQYFLKAKKLYGEIGEIQGFAKSIKMLGDLYAQQENFPAALNEYASAINKVALSMPEVTAELYLSIAKVNIEEEDYEEAIENLRRALVKYKLSNKMQQAAEVYVQYGEVYLKQKLYDKALVNFENALFIDRELQDFNKIAEDYNKIALIYYKSKKYELVIEASNNSLNYNTGYLKELEVSYLYLSKAYEKTKNTGESLAFLKKYLRIHDKIFEEKENKSFNEMQVSLELQRHEKEVEILKRDQDLQNEALKRSQLQTYFLLFGIFVLLLFAYYYYRTNKRTKQANREILRQKEELSKANIAILEQQSLIEKKNKDIESGINYAHRIQFALIPEKAKLAKLIPDSMVYFKPKDLISGDFYWFQRKRHQNKIFISAIDCTGHGVPGAFMSVLGNTLLNQIVGSGIYEADEILNNLHKMVRQALHQDSTSNRDGMDMAICVIDTEENTLDFAGAKNPLIYFEDDELKLIKGDMFSIGGIQREKVRRFTKHTIALSNNKEQVFYLFSDGYQDQFGGQEKFKFTRKRLRDLFSEIHTFDFEEQSKILEQTFVDWKGKYEQIDDILILGFRI